MTDDRAHGHVPQPQLDTSVPQSARVWNYWLGGKDNYPSDRAVGDHIRRTNPHIVEIAVAARAFLVRAVTHLTRDVGIRQFLDVGTGLPTANNTHEVAQAIAPDARIVYSDHDPLVLAHARALLVGTDEGATDYIDADLREPDVILSRAARTLDFDQPIALMLMGVVGHITDDEEAYSLVRRLVAALPSGSHLVLYDDTNVIHPETMNEMTRSWNETGQNPRVNRTPEKIAGFFEGLELLDPGVVSVSRWRPDEVEVGETVEVDDFCGVGRKP
ncbi:SAM-dependent methyltransferase [Nocardiopsis sp. HNM0947]|uniref:SAM-dependent methyltransferase n=1 Tax=Nocardiopsis coralli TaxID=2772213 RepID=A0ABR9PE40_9ACTN|nr:SAM-dependent methyltransferase [Nocardiopsis coralli]MBE3002089.1 SAM-dependent methyltransferase [Nocardiopsis coralli]